MYASKKVLVNKFRYQDDNEFDFASSKSKPLSHNKTQDFESKIMHRNSSEYNEQERLVIVIKDWYWPSTVINLD